MIAAAIAAGARMLIFEIQDSSSQEESVLTSDRRMHRRVAMRTPASVCLGGGPWHDAGLTRNISAGGALVELPARLAAEYSAGDPIGFEVRIPAGEGVWPEPTTGMAEAVVLRTYDVVDDGDETIDSKLVALRFVDRLRFQHD